MVLAFCFSMEAFVQSRSVLDAIAEASKPKNRKSYTAAEIEAVTKQARHLGTTSASKKTYTISSRTFKVPENTVRDWLQHFQETGDFAGG